MKSNLFIIIFLNSIVISLICCESKKEEFEGVISYSVKLTYDTSNVILNKTVEQLKIDGDIPVDSLKYYFYEDGSFYTISNYKDKNYFHIYDIDQKILYNIYQQDSVAVGLKVELPESEHEIVERKITTDTLVISDKICDVVTYKWKAGKYKYFYNDNYLNTNPELFKGFEYDKFYDFLKISKSLPFKIEKEIFGLYKIELELVEYNKRTLDKNKLRIPKLRELDLLKGIYKNKSIYTIES